MGGFIAPPSSEYLLPTVKLCGDDVPKFEPKRRLNFAIIDKSIQELRAIFKVHPEWFETSRPKSYKGKKRGGLFHKVIILHFINQTVFYIKTHSF